MRLLVLVTGAHQAIACARGAPDPWVGDERETGVSPAALGELPLYPGSDAATGVECGGDEVLLGAWVIAAPLVLGAPARADLGGVVAGLVLAVAGVVPIATGGSYGGGWSALLSRPSAESPER